MSKFAKLDKATNEAEITKAIQSIHKRGGALQLDIHHVLVAVAVRWATSGDMRPVAAHINLLLTKDQIGGVRKNAIRAWVETHMQLAISEETKEFYVPTPLKSGNHLKLKDLANSRWWEFKPEPEYQPINDAHKLVSQLVAKLQKDRDTLGDKSEVPAELIAALKEANTPEVLH